MNESGGVKPYSEFVLPAGIVTARDVSHLVQEVERVDNELTTAAVQAKMGNSNAAQPGLTDQLSAFLQQNNLSLENSQVRTELITQLRLLKDKAPTVHMTFAGAADSGSLQQLAAWFRASVHPQTVIVASVQPALVAGVYVRTPNHVHDFSVRSQLSAQRAGLVAQLEALRGAK